jgi:hypothetical protein
MRKLFMLALTALLLATAAFAQNQKTHYVGKVVVEPDDVVLKDNDTFVREWVAKVAKEREASGMAPLAAPATGVTCNSTTNKDNRGKWCTNATLPAGEYPVTGAGTNYWPMTEDRCPHNPDFPGSIGFTPGPNTVAASLPCDPLKEHDVVFDGFDTQFTSVLDSANFPSDAVPVLTYGPPNGCRGGRQWLIFTWPLHDIINPSQINSGYNYKWDGTFVQNFVGTIHINRGGCATYYKTRTASPMELSATKIP